MTYPLSDATLAAIAARINTRHPLVHNPAERRLAYGTAGFRTVGNLLAPVAARVVIIAVLRAWQCSAAALARGHSFGSTVGFMITASHNPAQDNGFKIIDEDGGMLAPSWEPWCFKVANAATGEDVATVVKECMEAEKITMPITDLKPGLYGTVQLGRDTRASGDTILKATTDILDSVLRIAYTDHGIVTTPQLHFVTYQANLLPVQTGLVDVNVGLHCREILSALDNLMRLCDRKRAAPRQLVVDAANGVGYFGLESLIAYAREHEINGTKNVFGKYFDITVVNTHVKNADLLNKDCGAEFAHKKQKPSAEMLKWAEDNGRVAADQGPHYYCLDGDADRLVSFAHSSDCGVWRMIDGDRTSILYAILLHRWLGPDVMKGVDIGIVQTAYANGASTTYVEDTLKMKVYMAATGVKNLHPIAHDRDIGVYFEANGHGTILFKDHVKDKISPTDANADKVLRILTELPKLLSQVCGDAIADMLMCEVALVALNLTPAGWADLYADRPSLQATVTVPNPAVITNTKDETRALTPAGLQEAIDAAVEKVKCSLGGGVNAAARSFVRPSGTEPIVRVYAEATTREATESLSLEVQGLVKSFCS